jgi:hypothetical protein
MAGGCGGGGGEREARACGCGGEWWGGKTARGEEEWREQGNRQDLAGKRLVFWRERALWTLVRAPVRLGFGCWSGETRPVAGLLVYGLQTGMIRAP